MPHDVKFDVDFRSYAAKRRSVQTKIRELQAYLAQLANVVDAMPSDSGSAGYLDLDNVEQLQADLDVVLESEFCDWDGLGMEYCRLGLPTC